MRSFNFSLRSLASIALMTAASTALAHGLHVDNAWARASVAGQKATGAFMTLSAHEGVRVVGASSPVAGVTEIHEMVMEGDVMKMRAISELDVPAGKAVELKPGGHHVMLMDLKEPLKADSTVPITLIFKDAKGAESRKELQVPVRAVNAPAKSHGSGHDHKH